MVWRPMCGLRHAWEKGAMRLLWPPEVLPTIAGERKAQAQRKGLAIWAISPKFRGLLGETSNLGHRVVHSLETEVETCYRCQIWRKVTSTTNIHSWPEYSLREVLICKLIDFSWSFQSISRIQKNYKIREFRFNQEDWASRFPRNCQKMCCRISLIKTGWKEVK